MKAKVNLLSKGQRKVGGLWYYIYLGSPKSLGIWNKVSHKYIGKKNKITANCYFIRRKTLNSDYAVSGATSCNIHPVSSTTVQFITMNTNTVTVFSGSVASAFFRASLGRNHLSAAAIKAASARHRECWQLQSGQERDSVPIKGVGVLMLMLMAAGSRSRSSNFSAGSLPKPPMSKLRLKERR